MSTLEKFGILVILILVVIIGVVAVWGVGGEEGTNPFETGRDVATVPTPPSPAGDLPPWPGSGPAATPVPAATAPGPIAPPAVAAPVTPASEPVAARSDPVGPASAPAGDGSTYVVKKGDTLTRIARETLGDGNRYQEILSANPGLDARRLKIGMTLRIPSGTAVARETAAPRPAVHSFAPNPDDGPTGAVPAVSPTTVAAAGGVREVVVEEGDSFWKLAERYCGNGSMYSKIAGLNPKVDPRKLRKGMTVLVPAAE